MENKKTLYLHVGLSKTGTSFIQSSLAYSRNELLKHGLYYPVFSEKPDSKYGLINSGNGFFLAQLLNPSLAKNTFNEDQAWQRLKSAICSEYNKVLVSSEFLASAQPEQLEELKIQMKDINTEVKVIIFLRSILERTYSNWQQGVKRHGTVKDFESVVTRAQENHSYRLNKLVNIFGKENIAIYNYDTKKSLLLECMANFLEVPHIRACPVKIVNRSLGLRETSRMLYINKLSQEKAPHKAAEIGTVISDLMVETDPALEKNDIQITEKAREIFVENNLNILEKINSTFMAGDPIKLSLHETSNSKIKFPALNDDEKTVLTAIHSFLEGKDPNYIDPKKIEQLDTTSIFILSSRAYLKQNQVKNAQWAAEQAVRRAPLEPRAYYELAKSLDKNKEISSAIDAMQKAVEIWPEKTEYQSYLGYLLSKKLNIRGANKAFRKALDSIDNRNNNKHKLLNIVKWFKTYNK